MSSDGTPSDNDLTGSFFQRILNVFELSSLLLVVAVAYGSFILWREGHDEWLAILRIAHDPAIATLLLMFIGVLFQDVFGGGLFRFPLNLTLPSLFVALVLTTKILREVGLAFAYRAGEPERYDLMWNRPMALITLWLIQIVTMGILLLFLGARRRLMGQHS